MKIYFEMHYGLNVKPEPIKILKENIGDYLHGAVKIREKGQPLS